jgi:hypothetical protein
LRNFILASFLCFSILFFGACDKSAKDDSGITLKPAEVEAVMKGEHDSLLIERALGLLAIAENYTSDNFEAQQRKALLLLTDSFRKVAEEYLPNRVKDVQSGQYSLSHVPDMDSGVVESRQHFSGAAEVRVSVDADVATSSPNMAESISRRRFTVTMLVYSLEDIKISQWTMGNSQ